MKKVNKVLSGLLSVSLIAALSACGGGTTTPADGTTAAGGAAEATTTTTEATTVTTTVATVEIVTTTFADEEAAAIAAAAEQLPDVEMTTNEIKWLAHYDINPNTAGQPKSAALQLFEEKYGGTVKWYETTWNTRFDDLSTYVLGGEGVDFFPGDDEANYPKGVVNGMFQSIDQYIDINDPMWDSVRPGMEAVNFGGKHYEFVTGVASRFVLAYSANTIEENGLEDPYEQWQNGEWNWDTFKASLLDFVDAENDMHGLDGWWFERGLFGTVGVPVVGVTDGQLVCNLNSPEIEKVSNFGYDLWQNGLILDKSLFSWSIHPEYMGEGKELFFIVGAYEFNQSPDVWPQKISPEDLRIVPVPGPADQETPYTVTRIDGFSLLKGATNPAGVAAYTYCSILAGQDEDVKAISRRQQQTDYQLSDIVLDSIAAVDQIAADNPRVEFAAGSSNDIMQLTTDGGETVGIRAAFHGTDWATTREAISDSVNLLVEEVNTALQAAVAAE
ncbi:MAG: hypothetical protein LBL98_01355 [Ruminococcus sp.]|jgi:hypothetical protein|nr:hypothetical protein [Ruminococcus sp.]